jgi:hypothetical protein
VDSQPGDFDEADVIRRGNLHKMGKDGIEDSCQFVLTHSALHYHVTSGPGAMIGGGFKHVPLVGVVAAYVAHIILWLV